MDPQPGDKRVQVTAADVTAAFHEVGVTAGDTVLFHSSLSSMGTVVGGPDTVIDGCLAAVGPTGTVAVPTLCNWLPDEQELVFGRWDPATTPSYVGRLTEHFRHRPDAVRSDHATHSVAASGARAAALTADHGTAGRRPGPFGDRAFAAASPWQRLVDWRTAYAFIGVTFRVCTLVHFVETQVACRALDRAAPDRRAALAAEVAGWMTPGVWPTVRVADRELFEAQLAEQGLVRYAALGSATLRCARADVIAREWVALLEADPDRWLPEAYVAWARRAAE